MKLVRPGRQGSVQVSRRVLVAGGITAVAATALAAAVPARYIDRVYPGTVVFGQDLSGLTVDEAVARVQATIRTTVDALVTFRLDDREWVATAAAVGVSVDWDRLGNEVFARGREGVGERLAALAPGGNPRTVSLPVTLDGTILDGWLAQLADDVAVASTDARLDGEGGGIGVVPDVDGRRLDPDAARTVILDAAAALRPATADVPVLPVAADITTDQLVATRDRVIRLTGEAIMISAGRDGWAITPDQLTGGLVMPADTLADDPWLDPWWIDQLLAPVVEGLEEPATDAILGWDGGLYAIEKSRAGRMVDRERLLGLVLAAADAEGDDRTVAVPTETIVPRIDSDDLDALGITGLVAAGDSSFAGSSEARTTNVGVSAYWVSQAAIAPGEVFSFNDALGPITEDRGYVTGKVIVGNWFADDLGGGVCQVSTTVYRAALYAGLPITEWHAHSARVPFYELDGWPMGVDAAIYQIDPAEGWPLNLTFLNTTGSWLLLQMANDGVSITASLFGPTTGWDVEIPWPKISPPIAPPAPQTRTTDELPAGERRVIQQAQDGFRAELHRTVTGADGNVSLDHVITSNYAPLPQITEVGGEPSPSATGDAAGR